MNVGNEGKEAKFWLDPIRLARSLRFREEELSEIERILDEHRNEVLEAWNKEQVKRGHG